MSGTRLPTLVVAGRMLPIGVYPAPMVPRNTSLVLADLCESQTRMKRPSSALHPLGSEEFGDSRGPRATVQDNFVYPGANIGDVSRVAAGLVGPVPVVLTSPGGRRSGFPQYWTRGVASKAWLFRTLRGARRNRTTRQRYQKTQPLSNDPRVLRLLRTRRGRRPRG